MSESADTVGTANTGAGQRGAGRELSRKKRFLFSLGTAAGAVLLVEVVFRLVFAFAVAPSVMLCGLNSAQTRVGPKKEESHSVSTPDYAVGSYSKYEPNQVRFDKDPETGRRFQAEINSRGFRGRDFDQKKAPGVVRLVTLGASSTFGYYSRLEQTYPSQFERILNAMTDGEHAFEVINLGVPHSTSSNLVAVFLAEALTLEPDVVTFYQGDSMTSTRG